MSLGSEAPEHRDKRLDRTVSRAPLLLWLQLRLERVWVYIPQSVRELCHHRTTFLNVLLCRWEMLEFDSRTFSWKARHLKNNYVAEPGEVLEPLSAAFHLAPYSSLQNVSPHSFLSLTHENGKTRDNTNIVERRKLLSHQLAPKFFSGNGLSLLRYGS